MILDVFLKLICTAALLWKSSDQAVLPAIRQSILPSPNFSAIPTIPSEIEPLTRSIPIGKLKPGRIRNVTWTITVSSPLFSFNLSNVRREETTTSDTRHSTQFFDSSTGSTSSLDLELSSGEEPIGELDGMSPRNKLPEPSVAEWQSDNSVTWASIPSITSAPQTSPEQDHSVPPDVKTARYPWLQDKDDSAENETPNFPILANHDLSTNGMPDQPDGEEMRSRVPTAADIEEADDIGELIHFLNDTTDALHRTEDPGDVSESSVMAELESDPEAFATQLPTIPEASTPLEGTTSARSGINSDVHVEFQVMGNTDEHSNSRPEHIREPESTSKLSDDFVSEGQSHKELESSENTRIATTTLESELAHWNSTFGNGVSEVSKETTLASRPECPPPGVCLFWFLAQDACAVDSHCLGSRICCKTRCSKTCIDI